MKQQSGWRVEGARTRWRGQAARVGACSGCNIGSRNSSNRAKNSKEKKKRVASLNILRSQVESSVRRARAVIIEWYVATARGKTLWDPVKTRSLWLCYQVAFGVALDKSRVRFRTFAFSLFSDSKRIKRKTNCG